MSSNTIVLEDIYATLIIVKIKSHKKFLIYSADIASVGTGVGKAPTSSGLIWVETVCKSYKQRVLVAKELRNTSEL